MAKIKIGVFGAHRGMDMIHKVMDHPDAELVAVCDGFQPALDNCRSEAEKAGMDKIAYYTSFDEFLNSDMEAVILANYANEHASYGIRLLDSGRHIMTECLTCATMKEAVELIEAVERSGKVYNYSENFAYSAIRLEMRNRYRRGDIGELMYAEGEYVHDCSSLWPKITYGDRNHWRNQIYSTFYCTHSIGPILAMTGLRPVKVSGFETRNMPFMWNLGSRTPCCGMEILTLNNGAIVKSLHGNLKHNGGYNYQLNGDRGAMTDRATGELAVYTEGENENCRGKYESYTPEHMVPEAAKSGGGSGDFYTTHFFIQSILGDEMAKEYAVDVYQAVDMCIPGILAYKSIVNGNASFDVPNLRNKEERDAYRNDTFCTFPDIAGEQWVDCNIQGCEPVPDSVYEEVRRKWKAGEPG